MTKRDQRRILREWCDTMKARLLRNVAEFPPEWNGLHIRALAATLAQDELTLDAVKRAKREMQHDARWYRLPL